MCLDIYIYIYVCVCVCVSVGVGVGVGVWVCACASQDLKFIRVDQWEGLREIGTMGLKLPKLPMNFSNCSKLTQCNVPFHAK